MSRQATGFAMIAAVLLAATGTFAVTSKVTRYSSASDFQKGQTDNVIISSQGTLQLGSKVDIVAASLADAWTVNTLISDQNGIVYVGTSPNGVIYKFNANGTVKKLYPADSNSAAKKDANDVNDANKPAKSDANQQYLTNEHIFAFGLDAVGRVLAGVSGKKCKLIRFENDEPQVLFEPNDASYIFAIVTDDMGSIYLGTGPKGKVYRLNPFGQKPELIYTSADKNVLSLAAGPDNMLYAGTDERGLVYKIDPMNKTATVLYDSEQSEITSLEFDNQGNLYAAATSATVIKGERTPLENAPGKPEAPAGQKSGSGAIQLETANAPKATMEETQAKFKAMLGRAAAPTMTSHIYKIDRQGYVTDVFQDAVIFFDIALRDSQILIGTGNKGQLLGVDPETEMKEIVYQDKQSTQVTSIITVGEATYVGMGNPAKIIRLSKDVAASGSYTSPLVDAGQPAKWGKLQIEATMPAQTRIQVSARTGNVGDINDPTYSPWTPLRDANEPVQLDVPLGRYCQYKLTLSGNGQDTPVVREVAVPYVVPNMAPQIEAVAATRIESADKPGFFTIAYKGTDRNSDKLIYRIDLRRVGTGSWIKIKDNFEAETYVWDSKTVEDGRYEIKVTASDERSNTSTTKLSGSRVSDIITIDNTGPAIVSPVVDVNDNNATVKFTATDKLSAIGNISYTIDSNAEWIGTLPVDLVYDTLSEDFAIVASKLAPGEHIISVRVTDAVGNTTYKSFDVAVEKAQDK